jgi:hypothetical protein
MTQYLPPNLLALFAPREPLPYLKPLDTLPWEKKPWPYNGVSQYLSLFEDPNETPPATRGETKEERVARKVDNVAYTIVSCRYAILLLFLLCTFKPAGYMLAVSCVRATMSIHSLRSSVVLFALPLPCDFIVDILKSTPC